MDRFRDGVDSRRGLRELSVYRLEERPRRPDLRGTVHVYWKHTVGIEGYCQVRSARVGGSRGGHVAGWYNLDCVGWDWYVRVCRFPGPRIADERLRPGTGG